MPSTFRNIISVSLLLLVASLTAKAQFDGLSDEELKQKADGYVDVVWQTLDRDVQEKTLDSLYHLTGFCEPNTRADILYLVSLHDQ